LVLNYVNVKESETNNIGVTYNQK